MNISLILRNVANETVDSLLAEIHCESFDCESFDFEQLEVELADWLFQQLQQAKPISIYSCSDHD